MILVLFERLGIGAFRIILLSALLFCQCGESSLAGSMSNARKAQALEYVDQSLRSTLATVGDHFPVATEKGVWELNNGGWTGGYFAGMLWLMYKATGEEHWRREAEKYTWLLEGYKSNVDMSDVGILFWPSFDLGYSLTGNKEFREVGLEGARSMMRRFIPEVGYVQNWGNLGEKEQRGFVIIDCLINLDHLYWASRETGDPGFARAATSHAELTRLSHVRPDFSSYQVVEFDPADGRKLRAFTKQGHSDESTWSRGQSWGIYGFTRAYKNSGRKVFLTTARKMADWFIERLPSDSVPYWDFSAPGIPDEPRDTSSASMAASGLLELAQLCGEPACAERYRQSAETILSSLTNNYLTRDLEGRNDGVLTGGTYFHRIGRSVGQASIWGDFYYLEALLRLEE